MPKKKYCEKYESLNPGTYLYIPNLQATSEASGRDDEWMMMNEWE